MGDVRVPEFQDLFQAGVMMDGTERSPELGDFYEGDIILPATNPGTRGFVAKYERRWPEGVVPYVMSPLFEPDQAQKILQAIRLIEERTCVQFVPREPYHESFITIDGDKNGCFAQLGKVMGRNRVNYSKECFGKIGYIIHEILHVLGTYHEQARTDRDHYVRIMWENVDEKAKVNFKSFNPEDLTTFGLPYDYGSVMHYPPSAFSTGGSPTIIALVDTLYDLVGKSQKTVKYHHPNYTVFPQISREALAGAHVHKPYVKMGQRDGPTEQDLLKVNIAYNCTEFF